MTSCQFWSVQGWNLLPNEWILEPGCTALLILSKDATACKIPYRTCHQSLSFLLPQQHYTNYFDPQVKALSHHPKFSRELCLRFLNTMLTKVLVLSRLNQAISCSLLSLSFFVLFSLDRSLEKQGRLVSYHLSSLLNGICTPFITFSFWIIQSATKLLSAVMLMHLFNNITFICESAQNALCAFESTLSVLLFFWNYWFPAF